MASPPADSPYLEPKGTVLVNPGKRTAETGGQPQAKRQKVVHAKPAADSVTTVIPRVSSQAAAALGQSRPPSHASTTSHNPPAAAPPPNAPSQLVMAMPKPT